MTDQSGRPPPPRRSRPLLIILVAVLAFVVVGIGVAVSSGGFVDSFLQGYDKSFDTSMRVSCRKSASVSLEKGGTDPTTPTAVARIASYCDCVADRTKTEMTRTEVLTATSGAGNTETQTKLNTIVQACAEKAKQ